MSTLIITLALRGDGPATEYDYVLTSDGQSLSAQGRASAALLPATSGRGGSVVVVVPARAMSWHQVKLPATIGKWVLGRQADQPRLRAVLAGLMEEYLLDDPEQLHFAVFPGARPDAPVWVAVCHRAWLHEALQVLEDSGHPVSRIVPEFAPVVDTAASSTAYVTAGLEPAQLTLCTPNGVTVLPLGAAAASMVTRTEPVDILAEPVLAALAEQTFRQPVSLQTRAQRQLQAANTAWNLAQFDLSTSHRAQVLKALSRGWLVLSREPQWRPVRWGLVLVLLTHVLGLNALAWKEKSLLDEKQDAIHTLFTQTFPEVAVIVDAPLQMAREVAVLQRATGNLSGPGLVEISTAIASAVPIYRAPAAIELIANEFRIKGIALSADESTVLVRKLSTQGLRAHVQGDLFVIQQADSP
jgi:general secretion pathway protein L